MLGPVPEERIPRIAGVFQNRPYGAALPAVSQPVPILIRSSRAYPRLDLLALILIILYKDRTVTAVSSRALCSLTAPQVTGSHMRPSPNHRWPHHGPVLGGQLRDKPIGKGVRLDLRGCGDTESFHEGYDTSY